MRTVTAACLLWVSVLAAQAPVPSPPAAIRHPQERALAEERFAQGEAHQAAHRYAQALVCFKEAGAAMARAEDFDLVMVIQAKSGFMAYLLGDFKEAAALWQPVVPYAAANGNWKMEAQISSNLAQAIDMLGESQRGLLLLERALVLYRAHGETLKMAEILGNRGGFFYEQGDWAGAEKDWTQALALYREGGGSEQNQMPYLQSLGQVYCDMGDPDRGRPLLERALSAARANQNTYVEAAVLNALGTLYDGLHAVPKAIDYYQQALALWEQRGYQSGQATSHNNLAAAYLKQDRFAEARAEFARSLALSRAIGKKAGVATALANLARIDSLAGSLAEARAGMEASLALRREVGDRCGEAICLATLGELALKAKQPDLALGHFTQALWIQEAIGDRHQGVRTLGLMMKAHGAAGNPARAIVFGQAALLKLQELRAGMRGMPSELMRGFTVTYAPIMRGLADLLLATGSLPEAHAVIQRLKEEEYRGFVRQALATGHLEPILALTPWQRQEAEAFLRVREPAYRLTTEEAGLRPRAAEDLTADERARRLALTTELQHAKAAFEAFLDGEARPPAGAAPALGGEGPGRARPALAKALGTKAATLHFIVTDHHVGVLLTTARGQWAEYYPIPEVELNQKIFAFRRCVQNPAQDPLPLAQELYRILIKPMAKHLRREKPATILLGLDGALRYVPFAALHDGQRYLAETFALASLTEAAPLEPGDRRPKSWRFMGFGVTQAWGELPALPNVARELNSIVQKGKAGLLPGRVALDGAFTVPSLLASVREGAPVLHLATHFRLVPGTEDHSFLLLGDGSQLSLRRFRDQAPDLRGVDLLTLSACETALGLGQDQDGKEVEGLATLAQRFGVHSVLATLWPVADQRAAPLVHRFYRLRGRQGQLTKVEALRRAQVSLLRAKRYRHPCHWANFILLGDPQ